MVTFISHRGESCDAPENTVSAFRLAAERKTDGVECDIYFTSDKVVVCCHDENALRTSGHDALVTDTSFAELRTWDFSNGKEQYRGEKIPTLKETLAALGDGMQIYIEVKRGNVAILPAMFEIIDGSGVASDRITIICFGQEVCTAVKEQRPEFRTLWLCTYPQDKPISADELVAELRKCNADGVDIDGRPAYVDAAFIATVKAAGFYFSVWTIDIDERARQLVRDGVDAITSNRAAAVMNALK